MDRNQDLIIKLIEKLELLYKKQADFTTEINSLKEELYRLKSTTDSATSFEKPIEEDIKPTPIKEVIEQPIVEKEDVKF